MPEQPLVIGFETSCDETGVGLVRGHTHSPLRSAGMYISDFSVSSHS